VSDKLEHLSTQVGKAGKAASPPLHLWHPPLSGDMDILIRRDGSWLHEGSPIRRQSLVRLFASILRREEDGDYYLVTPVEKWRIRVEFLPLVVVDFDLRNPATNAQELIVVTNTERCYSVSEQYPLFIATDPNRGQGGQPDRIPAVALEHGLAALFNRATWYRLAELCEESDQGPGLFSRGHFYPAQ